MQSIKNSLPRIILIDYLSNFPTQQIKKRKGVAADSQIKKMKRS